MRTLWTVGASARALAESLVKGGYCVVAADQFNDLDLRRLARSTALQNYPQSLLPLARSVAAEGWLYTGGLENYPDLVDEISQSLPLLGNCGAILREVRNLQKLNGILLRAGFQMPEMRGAVSSEDAGAWLRKSSRSSGGLRVRRASTNEAPLAEDEYYQRFIAEPSFGAVFIARDETAHLLGISRHLRALPASNTPEFRYAGSLGPVTFGEPLQTEIERLGNVLAKQFQLRGWFGIDFILDQNEQLWVLEVNPRYTASVEVLERAANVSSASLHLQACVGEPLAEDILALFRGKLPWVGKSILYAQHSTHATPEAWLQRSISRHDLADIPADNTQSKAGDPLLTIFATGESEQEVLLALQAKAHELSNPPE